ncbi:MAG: hypothetical protein VKO26_07045 [Cyanobacteriota bacterium]|nr:hypothetical protein [Cyanobacteriota bacterium]
MTPDTIALTLSIEEVNLILESLGELPFRRVFQLIGRIQAAARDQMPLVAGMDRPAAEPAASGAAVPSGEAAGATDGTAVEVG